MLRDLATVIEDLQGGMQVTAARAGVRVVQAEMTLPVDIAFVLKDGGCALLADVARNAADASWIQSPSRLTLNWGEVPTEALP
jgi:hypothetical protein